MKIVLDTNVLVSAFISKQGQPAAVLDLAVTFPEIELVLSQPILDEFKGVISRREVKERFGDADSTVERGGRTGRWKHASLTSTRANRRRVNRFFRETRRP